MMIVRHDRDANYCYNGNHIIISRCIKLTCCTSYIYTMTYVKYISVKNKNTCNEKRVGSRCFPCINIETLPCVILEYNKKYIFGPWHRSHNTLVISLVIRVISDHLFLYHLVFAPWFLTEELESLGWWVLFWMLMSWLPVGLLVASGLHVGYTETRPRED